jgi:peptidase inhibitor I78 family protein
MRPILAATLAIIGCAAVPRAEPPPPAPPPPAPDGLPCSAEGLEDLLGRPASQAVGAEAMRRSGARMLRWIRPGDAVTMDYSEHRLNVHLDERGRVQRFECG